MSKNANTKKIVRPIRFSRLEVGSKFNIFAEPSRGIQHSDDTRMYIKQDEVHSAEVGNEQLVILLYPEDLVVPRSRPKQ